MGEESTENPVGFPTRTCPSLNGPSWNGSARRTPSCGWSVISQKKWRPGSRKNSREVRGDRGLGHRQAVLGHVHVRPARRGPPGLLPVAGRRARASVSAPTPSSPSTIREIHTELHGHPGVRRVWAELVVRGVRAARKRVWRLMRPPACRDATPGPGRSTTVAGQRPIDAPDLIGQDFTAEAARHPLVRRHHLRADRRRLGLHRDRDRPALPQGRGLRRSRSPAHQPDRRGPRRRAA